MHVHYLQDETFTVLQGRIGYQIAGQEPSFAGEGETVVFPAGQAHRFWNAGEDELRCSAYIKPVGNAEYFLAALFASQKSNGGRRPALLDLAFLTRRYRSEYRMVEIPGITSGWCSPSSQRSMVRSVSTRSTRTPRNRWSAEGRESPDARGVPTTRFIQAVLPL